MAQKSVNEKTFIKITNQDIYQKLEILIAQNNEAHSKIIDKQTQTNGKLKLALYIATSTATGLLVLAGFLFQHINIHK